MKRKVFALGIDGCETADEVIRLMIDTLSEPRELIDYVSHIKLNDALHLEGKYEILKFIAVSYPDLNIFFDLKLQDTNGTDVNILKKYVGYMRPGDVVTVVATASLKAFYDIRAIMPIGVKIALVSVLTDTNRDECQSRRGAFPAISILNDALNLIELGATPFDAVVCGPAELKFLKQNLPSYIKFIVPGIRDSWMDAGQQASDRIGGIKETLDDGADILVLAGQFIKGNPKKEVSAVESRVRSIMRALESSTINLISGNPLETLINLQGHYKSLKTPDGKIKGPLVAYAGPYQSPTGEKNYVGDTYFNLAVIEEHPKILSYYAELMAVKIRQYEKASGIKVSCLVGVPTGGVKIAQAVGQILNIPGICLEKEVLVVKTATEKEKFDLIFRRNAGVIKSRDTVVIFEDLCNNFATTLKSFTAVEKVGGEVVAIACVVNRSMKYVDLWKDLQIISGISIPSDQYEQEDPAVAELIAQGELSTDPKKDWELLKKAMEE